MVGMPDYENYVEHRQTCHPGEPVMTYEEFFRNRLQARYGVGRGNSEAAARIGSCGQFAGENACRTIPQRRPREGADPR